VSFLKFFSRIIKMKRNMRNVLELLGAVMAAMWRHRKHHRLERKRKIRRLLRGAIPAMLEHQRKRWPERRRTIARWVRRASITLGMAVPFLLDISVSGSAVSISTNSLSFPPSLTEHFSELAKAERLALATEVSVELGDRLNDVLALMDIKVTAAGVVIAGLELLRRGIGRAELGDAGRLDRLGASLSAVWRGLLTGAALWLLWQAAQLLWFIEVVNPYANGEFIRMYLAEIGVRPSTQVEVIRLDLAIDQTLQRARQAVFTATGLIIGALAVAFAMAGLSWVQGRAQRGPLLEPRRSWRLSVTAGSAVAFLLWLGLWSAAHQSVDQVFGTPGSSAIGGLAFVVGAALAVVSVLVARFAGGSAVVIMSAAAIGLSVLPMLSVEPYVLARGEIPPQVRLASRFLGERICLERLSPSNDVEPGNFWVLDRSDWGGSYPARQAVPLSRPISVRSKPGCP
jgi:hypothetical protein